jgi:phage/plasmid-like protein (TIGR03299 family)
MPAGIEYDASTGRAMFVAVEEHGWHQMGTLVKGRSISVTEALELAHMNDLDYRLEPFAIIAGDPPNLVSAGALRAVARRKPFDRDKHEVIAAGLTDDFTMHTPEQAFGLGENLIDAGKPVAALGSINDGKRAFAAFFADSISIGGVDQVNMYLNVMTAFDGSMATTCRVSAIRVVCQNTFSAVMNQHSMPTYRVRHVGDGLEGRIEDARATLDMGYAGMTEFQKEAEAFLAVDVTDAKFAKIVESLLPMPDADDEKATPAQRDRIAQQRDQVTGLWTSSTVSNVQNTAWGALNAWTEWLDWTAGNFRTPQARLHQQTTAGSALDKRRIAGATKIAALAGVKIPA